MNTATTTPVTYPGNGPLAFQRILDQHLRTNLESSVAHVFRVSSDDIRGPSRGRAHVAYARQVAMYLAHVAWGMSLTDVGRLFDRDRTTVAHACEVVEDRRDDPAMDRCLDTLESIVRSFSTPPCFRLGIDD